MSFSNTGVPKVGSTEPLGSVKQGQGFRGLQAEGYWFNSLGFLQEIEEDLDTETVNDIKGHVSNLSESLIGYFTNLKNKDHHWVACKIHSK